ncbi:gliding motility associated protein GldN [Chitinophaga skermanii]|uniref:Gliding motility associated protein GldN n=1 Tax=Chitinophaga skermanii TaxID=331697 RepID=A0A327QKM7_9BACT|nr:gliding motility protein GldN [Chitinophaga skermanii]RAJ03903.1 gliding motility associated protein GldN [Chitinophaga skermanii]
MRAVITKKFALITLGIALIAIADVNAQRRSRNNRPTSTTQNQGAGDAGVTNPATGNAVTAPPPTPAAPAPAAMVADTPRVSLRVNGITAKNANKERVPIQYDHIREDDEFWEKEVWQIIDIREKMNLPFQYNVEDENGINQLFINILLSAIKNKEVEAFNPIDDRFTTTMSYQEIMTKLTGEEKTVRSIDPVTGEEKMVTTRDEFNPETIKQYKVREIWVFDKEASALKVRILGLAPMVARLNEDGSLRASVPLFWVYYPDMRPILARFDVYNQNNDAATMSWEDLFEMRFYTSYVIKEKNPYNREIKDYIKDGVMRLLEGQAIKDKIFNKEQDLWQY